MRLALLALLLLPTPLLTAQQREGRPVNLSLRVIGGVLDPDHPFRATGALGGAVGVRGRRLGISVTGIHQRQTADASNDLKESGRTFWGVAVEYSGVVQGRYRRAPMVDLGAGRVMRGSYDTVWYLNGGVGMRYPVGRHFAFVGRIDDYATFLPGEIGPRGPIQKQVQHNFAAFVTLELGL